MESPRLRTLRTLVNRNTIYQTLMFVFCVLFGLALTANIHPVGDGVWFWYATFIRSGHHLYSDLHLPLQPLFVLETSWFMALLGKGWLAAKVPAAIHVVAYCVALLWIIRYSKLSDKQRAIVLGCVFFVSIFFEAYRFDDYHVLADSFQLYSIVALLSLSRCISSRRSLSLMAVLGILSGLAITTRLNDGGALFASVAICIVCLAPSRRLLSLALFGCMALLTVVLVVSLTGDSLHDYAVNSIVKAAGSKGGAHSVLAEPLRLPFNTIRWLRDRWYEKVVVYSLGVCLVWALLFPPLARQFSLRNLLRAIGGLILIWIPFHQMHSAFLNSHLILALSAVGTLALYGIGLLVIFRCLRWQFSSSPAYQWDRRQILFLVPLGQLASGSMSSAGTHLGLYAPIGILILLVSVVAPVRWTAEWAKPFLLAVATMLCVAAAYYKINYPYAWHSYRERPLFVGRQWYRHPVYGPMVIDREQLAFIQSICDDVDKDKAETELLSLPFPYANYFCAIPPWHGYVQTFFDTSTKQTIDGLMDELSKSPPEWVLYQRQLDNLAGHERVYNHGQPLPHRFLDTLIEKKLESGEWHQILTSSYENRPDQSNEWILIRTK